MWVTLIIKKNEVTPQIPPANMVKSGHSGRMVYALHRREISSMNVSAMFFVFEHGSFLLFIEKKST